MNRKENARWQAGDKHTHSETECWRIVAQGQAATCGNQQPITPRLPPGTRYCKCPACGRFFGGVSGFDRHRVNAACVDPASVGLELNARGYWVRNGSNSTPSRGAPGVSGELTANPDQNRGATVASQMSRAQRPKQRGA